MIIKDVSQQFSLSADFFGVDKNPYYYVSAMVHD